MLIHVLNEAGDFNNVFLTFLGLFSRIFLYLSAAWV